MRAIGIATAAVLVIAMSGAANTQAEADAAGATPASVAREGRVLIVVAPEVYDDLTAHDVGVTDVGRRATTVPFKGTVKIKLPVKTADANGVTLDGGIRLTSLESQLTLRNLVIPASGFVSGTVRGTDVGDVGRASLFFQSPSDSELGDTSLRFTFTLAAYVNTSFDTDFVELGQFGYSTTHLRQPLPSGNDARSSYLGRPGADRSATSATDRAVHDAETSRPASSFGTRPRANTT